MPIYRPEVYRRLGGEVTRKVSTWLMDEIFAHIAGRRMHYSAVDSGGQTVDFCLSETQNREDRHIEERLQAMQGLRTTSTALGADSGDRGGTDDSHGTVSGITPRQNLPGQG
jgi:transposase-like protein